MKLQKRNENKMSEEIIDSVSLYDSYETVREKLFKVGAETTIEDEFVLLCPLTEKALTRNLVRYEHWPIYNSMISTLLNMDVSKLAAFKIKSGRTYAYVLVEKQGWWPFATPTYKFRIIGLFNYF